MDKIINWLLSVLSCLLNKSKKILFYCFFFKKEDIAAYEVVAHVKKKNTGQWYFNNLIFPILTVFSPMLLYFFSVDSKTFIFNRDITDFVISGSLTLMGLSVLRSAHTNIKDDVDDSLLSGHGLAIRNKILEKVNSLRGKLVRWSWVLTSFGWLFYVVQVGQIISKNSSYIQSYIIIFFIASGASIFIGRFMYLMDSNFLENSAATTLLCEIFKEDKSEEEVLRNQLKNQGL